MHAIYLDSWNGFKLEKKRRSIQNGMSDPINKLIVFETDFISYSTKVIEPLVQYTTVK